MSSHSLFCKSLSQFPLIFVSYCCSISQSTFKLFGSLLLRGELPPERVKETFQLLFKKEKWVKLMKKDVGEGWRGFTWIAPKKFK